MALVKDEHVDPAQADEITASQAEAEDKAYADVEDVWSDIVGILGSEHPVEWVRSTTRGHRDNYFDGCVKLWERLQATVDWEKVFPAACLSKQGGIVSLPLTFAALEERIGDLETCWKQVSKVRCMDVLKRIFVGGKGLETDVELPTLVVQMEFADKPLRELKFLSVHAGCTTRLMAAHTAMRLMIFLDMQGHRKNLFDVPEVAQAAISFARMNCHCRLMTAAERTVWALGPGPGVLCCAIHGRDSPSWKGSSRALSSLALERVGAIGGRASWVPGPKLKPRMTDSRASVVEFALHDYVVMCARVTWLCDVLALCGCARDASSWKGCFRPHYCSPWSGRAQLEGVSWVPGPRLKPRWRDSRASVVEFALHDYVVTCAQIIWLCDVFAFTLWLSGTPLPGKGVSGLSISRPGAGAAGGAHNYASWASRPELTPRRRQLPHPASRHVRNNNKHFLGSRTQAHATQKAKPSSHF
jgi:hypothetical protein